MGIFLKMIFQKATSMSNLHIVKYIVFTLQTWHDEFLFPLSAYLCNIQKVETVEHIFLFSYFYTKL